ncbi:hypothetical protein AUR63_07960 [Guyparkeria sp. XI15]|nr:hypothetical protein AUR63_07960 [Guyparkeria sp. XI15]OAE88391.1 hypothetical protein AWR35_07975 [Guyparkeria sp. WRN-7]
MAFATLLPIAASAEPQTGPGACQANHRLVITEARIGHEPGDVTGLPTAIADRLARRLETTGLQVVDIVPPTRSEGLSPAMDAFSRHAAPYFLRLAASDVGTQGRPSAFVLLPDQYQPRAGQLSATLDDGAQGARLGDWQFDLEPADGKPYSPEADAQAGAFWQSDWGEALDAGVERLAVEVLATLHCRPLVGRVLSTQARGSMIDLHVDLGREDGLRAGDRLTVIDPGMPADWLGVNLLTRPTLETTAGPVREPRSQGDARVTYLGQRDSTLRYTGRHAVESGDLVQVKPRRDRLKRLPN